MSLAKMRSMFEGSKRRPHGWSDSQFSEASSRGTFDPAPSFSTQLSEDLVSESDLHSFSKPPSDAEMLVRARDAHKSINFAALAAGPEGGGPWHRVEAANRFVVFKRPSWAGNTDNRIPGLEVMCAGRLDASLAEVASVLRSNSEIDLVNTMQGLHSKNFIFGSLDRDIP
ncbi:unnamed protein product [Phytophthora lilii]|uniref:Unnamed protein product n=1 Tax=Phytophthora lilii TaxID=2077276 RepID=A0A9W6U3U3_9STRA|nr:unnamed protein product [Phytophthora lilii]